MTRLAAWAASITLLVLGLVSLLGAVSLLMPATNPMSEAAPGFQASMLVGTLVAAVLLFLSEVAARRWSAPSGGWRWVWFPIGAGLLLLGTPLLLGSLGEANPLHRRTAGFRLGMGGIWVLLGIAGCGAALAPRARPDRGFDSPPRGG